ncbi:Heat shock transcription factor family protein [Dioscorea alata]|uniref:Heat shock transcription factor family protein n=1 Tax=Dioscorea alata TaxID=55571 RepID=A0ACB7V4Y8_DIOAL|nr:Heat shock transcription factor family protein [Dioscorea alata]
MTPYPPEPKSPAVPVESQRSSLTPFLLKTYRLVDDPAFNDVISWNSEGSAFVVWRPVEFARDLLPKFFKHGNFNSFVRQLNTYGFRKVTANQWEFAHESFRRGEKQLLHDIHRRSKNSISMAAATPPVAAVPLVVLSSPTNSGEEQGMSSSSSAVIVADLLSENERLRRKNEQLSRELSETKSLYNNILNLMSNYTAKNTVAVTAPDKVPQELMPAQPEHSHRLFGVSIGEKQIRSNEAEEHSHRLFGVSIGEKRIRNNEAKDPNTEVKRHPSDPRNRMLLCPPPANQ